MQSIQTNLPQGIGYRVRVLRETLGLSQEEFAVSVGATTVSLTNWEEKGQVPRNNHLKSIIKNYNVSQKWLALGKGEMFNEGGATLLQSVAASNPYEQKSEDELKDSLPYEFAMKHGCGDAASSFFAAFCSMNDQQKQIVVDSFKAVAKVFAEANSLSNAEIALDKDSVSIVETSESEQVESEQVDPTLFPSQEENQVVEEENKDAPKKKRRQQAWEGRVFAAKLKQKAFKKA